MESWADPEYFMGKGGQVIRQGEEQLRGSGRHSGVQGRAPGGGLERSLQKLMHMSIYTYSYFFAESVTKFDNPLTPIVAIRVQLLKHPVPDRVKPALF